MQLSQLPNISILSETLQISIPFELAKFSVWQRKLVNKYETNQVIRAIDTWLILKHLTTSGYVKQWNNQKKLLLQYCKCTDSILRHRLQLLNEMQLIELYKIERKQDSIKVCSWDHLATVLEINVKERLTIQYTTNDAKKIYQWIIATEIHDNKNRQDYKIITKLKKNAETYNAVLAAIIAAGADRTRVNDIQYFLSWYRIMYTNDFVRLSDIHEEMILIRPDNNRGVQGIANAWNAKHKTTVSYWKKVLQAQQIIDVSKLQIQSQQRARNKVCKVLWLKNDKQTLLCLCDQVTILRPWLRTDEFKNLFAA